MSKRYKDKSLEIIKISRLLWSVCPKRMFIQILCAACVSGCKCNMSYKEHADEIIEENMVGAICRSIFEPEAPVFNGAGEIQALINSYGSIKEHLIN